MGIVTKITTKYRGKCAICGLDIEKGEVVTWKQVTKALIHIGCEKIQELPTHGKVNRRERIFGMPLAFLRSDETPT